MSVRSYLDHNATSPLRPEAREAMIDALDRRSKYLLFRLAELGALEEALSLVAIVAVQAANNETAVIQPLSDVASLTKAKGGFVVCDAVQAVGRVPSSSSWPLWQESAVGARRVARRRVTECPQWV